MDTVFCILKFSDECIISVSYDRTIKLWNLDSDECLKTIIIHEEPEENQESEQEICM
jgi:WD40 repeat protein